jgi:hypothetical protein
MRKAAAALAPGCPPAWSFAINRSVMKPATNRLITSQRGMVLFTSLTILSVLLAVGIGVRTMLQNDYKVLTNLRSATDVFYLAAAGIEWSKSEFGRTPALAPLPANRTLSFQSGTISVSFMSPASLGPLSASTVVRSVGALGTPSHMIQAQLTKTYDLADAALGLRGNAAAVNLAGATIVISGADYDPVTAGPSAAKPRPAVSASSDALRDLFRQAVGSPPQVSLDSASASPAVTTSGFFPGPSLSQLVDSLCASPTAIVAGIPSGANLVMENQNWGTPSTPALRCFDGLLTGGDSLTLAGNNAGAGILLVKNADLVLSGSFSWEGLIIVSGADVGLRASGLGEKDIVGAILISETGSAASGKAIVDLQDQFRLRFSRRALARAAGLISEVLRTQTFSVAPFVITQNYWRTVNP